MHMQTLSLSPQRSPGSLSPLSVLSGLHGAFSGLQNSVVRFGGSDTSLPPISAISPPVRGSVSAEDLLGVCVGPMNKNTNGNITNQHPNYPVRSKSRIEFL